METPPPWKPPAASRCEKYEFEGLLIRYWRPEEAPAFLEAINEDRASFLPWLPWMKSDNRTLAEVTYNLERFRREREGPGAAHYSMGVFDASSGAVVGGTGLVRVHADRHESEIGYWVRPATRGKGACTRLLRGVLTWGFTPQEAGGWGFRRLVVKCAAANLPSRRVPEKVGLRLESSTRSESWLDGLGWTDGLSFGVLRDEWDLAGACIKRE